MIFKQIILIWSQATFHGTSMYSNPTQKRGWNESLKTCTKLVIHNKH